MRTTIRVNKKVWDDFKEFCEKQPNFHKKDLLSIALLEFEKNLVDYQNSV